MSSKRAVDTSSLARGALVILHIAGTQQCLRPYYIAVIFRKIEVFLQLVSVSNSVIALHAYLHTTGTND